MIIIGRILNKGIGNNLKFLNKGIGNDEDSNNNLKILSFPYKSLTILLEF